MHFPVRANTIIPRKERTDLRALHYISPSVWSAMPRAGLVPVLMPYAPLPHRYRCKFQSNTKISSKIPHPRFHCAVSNMFWRWL